MPIIDCPKCRERMRVEPSDFDDFVACPLCDHRFAPRGDTDDDLPRGRRSSSVQGDDFDRPAKKKSNALLWIILALVAIFILLPCGGCIGFFVYFSVAKADFPATWTDHSLAGAKGESAPVTAAFPSPPVTNLLADPANQGAGSTLSFDNMKQNQGMTDATFLVGYFDYPQGTERPLDIGYPPIRTAITDFLLGPRFR